MNRVLLSLLCGLLIAAAPPRRVFLTLPFLQHVRPDGITIVWESGEENPASLTVFEGDREAGSFPVSARDSGFDTRILHGEVSGLKPDTTYQYAVRSGDAESVGEFTTAPEGFRPFRFSVWGDSQGPNRGSWKADPHEPTKSMFRRMTADQPDFAVSVGDLAQDGDSYTQTREMFLDRVARLLGRTVPFFIAWGNHDGRPHDVLRKFADSPSRYREGFHGGYGSYAFSYAGCRFIAIDWRTMRGDVLTWLPGELEKPESRQARHRFLFVHVPPYSERWIDGVPFLREHLVPLAEAYRIDAVFSGHTHEYNRGRLNGVYYCISGGASWLDHHERIVKDWPHMTVGGAHDLPGLRGGLVNHYITVTVDEDGWNAAMHAFRPNGSYIAVLDRFGSGDRRAQAAPPSDR